MSKAGFLRGQDPKKTMGIGIANVIFKKTTSGDNRAYSYGLYYSDNEWMRIIRWLLKEKYTPFDIENILRSKLMRCTADNSGDYSTDTNKPWATLEDFINYNGRPYYFSPPYKSAIDDFLNREIYSQPYEEKYRRKAWGYDEKGNPINEDTGAPMTGAGSVPGMSNAVPAQQVATTGNQFYQSGVKGSGDIWGSGNQKQKKKRKRKKVKLVKESLNETNISPYDKLGVAIAKKMGVKLPFKKKKAKENQNSMKQTIK
jgi:hypothetical protein